jgi:hypothetical protein
MGARALIKASALQMVGFIVARPRLEAYLRRQMFRFPGLASHVRAAVTRSRRAHQNMASGITGDDDLTDHARLVLHDLARAAAHMHKR